jgi:hypothetical protein
VDAEWRRLGANVRIRFWDALLDKYFGRARRDLGQVAAAQARAEGRAMTLGEAMVQALEADP